MFFLVSTRNVLCNSNRSFYYRNQCDFFIDFLSRWWFDPLTRMTRILPSEHLWISTAETWTYKHSFCDVILLFMLRDEDITSSSASISPTGRTGEKKVSLNFHLHVVWGGMIRAKKWMWTRDKWDSMSEKKKKIMGNLHCNAMGAVDLRQESWRAKKQLQETATRGKEREIHKIVYAIFVSEPKPKWWNICTSKGGTRQLKKEDRNGDRKSSKIDRIPFLCI